MLPLHCLLDNEVFELLNLCVIKYALIGTYIFENKGLQVNVNFKFDLISLNIDSQTMENGMFVKTDSLLLDKLALFKTIQQI